MNLLVLFLVMEFFPFRKRAYINANNKFSVILFNEVLNEREDSFFLSPSSLETSLIFLISGCKSTNAKEIFNIMCLSNKKKDIPEIARSVQEQVKSFEQYTIKYSNKLYVSKDVEIKEEFKKTAKEVHEASVENIDFSKSVFATQSINNWVKLQTDHYIPELTESQDMDNVTDAILVNVAYFRANWADPFLIANTKKGIFFKPDHEIIEVDVMNSTDKYCNYYDDYKLQAKFLEMPFIGNDASMIFIVPYKVDGLATLQKRIDKVLKITSFESELVNVSVPKFKLTSKHFFKRNLQNVGLLSIFRYDEADLSDIAEDKGELVINDIIQGVTIDVSEEGIGAIAAAAVLVPMPQRTQIRKRPKIFMADRPFLFFIKVKNVIICAGRILDPEQ